MLGTLGDRVLTFESTGSAQELSVRIIAGVLERLARG
jgi:hypothetical protein